MEPLISIVTATYNSEKFIMELAKNINKQSYKNWEWVIVDDASTDNTVSCLKEISSRFENVSYYINDVNSGAAVSRNLALKMSKGDYIAFIDSDDLWDECKLRLQIDYMLEMNISFSFTAYDVINESGQSLGTIIDKDNRKDVFDYNDMLRKRATLGCSTVMISRNVINDLTMPLLRTGQDYAFWLKILKQGVHAYLIKDVLTHYRIVAGSISRNKIKKAKRQWQIYREVEGISLTMSFFYFLNYAIRAVLRG